MTNAANRSSTTHKRGYRKTDRKSQADRVTLDAPLILARWSKNRSGAAITITLKTYEGANIFDLRTFMSDRGVLKPAKGFACMVSHLPRLAKEIAKAVETAIELGLIDGAAK